MLHWLLLASLFHEHPTRPDTRLIDRVITSVVRVTGEKTVLTPHGPFTGHTVCTGFIIATHYVLTANHCIHDSLQVDALDATIVSQNDYLDLALLTAPVNKAPLRLREAPLARFESILSIGYGFGLTEPLTVSAHVLLLTTRPWEDDDTEQPVPLGFIVQPGFIGGMSGGPIVDANGLVVGIIQQSNSGIGYGVSVPTLKVFRLEAGQ